MAHDHSVAANNAISKAVKHLRPSATGSWMLMVPDAAPLNFLSVPDWMNFLGEILANYASSIPGCEAPTAGSLQSFKSKTLIQLRDAMVEGTLCA